MANMDREVLAQKLYPITLKGILNFRRDIQKALADYSKGFPLDKETQENGIGLLAQVDRWAYKAYAKKRKAELLRHNQYDLKIAKGRWKLVLKAEFEKMMKDNAY